MVCISLQLVAINVITSLTVEAARDTGRLRQLTRRTLGHSMRLVAPLALLTAAIAPVALLVFGQAYADAGTTLLRLLAIGAIPNVFVALGIGVARIEHKGQWVALVQGAQVTIVLGGSAVLLPGVGIEAVGFTWAGSQFLLAAVMLATILRPLLLTGRADDREPRPGA
jgi:O-antigen/teichoic acid export membrane protein